MNDEARQARAMVDALRIMMGMDPIYGTKQVDESPFHTMPDDVLGDEFAEFEFEGGAS